MSKYVEGAPISVRNTRAVPQQGHYFGNNLTRSAETGLVERKPSTCSIGDLTDPQPHPLGKSWYREVLTHHGNIVNAPITNSSADLNTDSEYARAQLAQHKEFGWVPYRGVCVVRSLKNGDVLPDRLRDQSLLTEKVCPTDKLHADRCCPHVKRELEARRARWLTEDPSRSIQDVHDEAAAKPARDAASAAATAAAAAVAQTLPSLVEAIAKKGGK